MLRATHIETYSRKKGGKNVVPRTLWRDIAVSLFTHLGLALLSDKEMTRIGKAIKESALTLRIECSCFEQFSQSRLSLLYLVRSSPHFHPSISISRPLPRPGKARIWNKVKDVNRDTILTEDVTPYIRDVKCHFNDKSDPVWMAALAINQNASSKSSPTPSGDSARRRGHDDDSGSDSGSGSGSGSDSDSGSESDSGSSSDSDDAKQKKKMQKKKHPSSSSGASRDSSWSPSDGCRGSASPLNSGGGGAAVERALAMLQSAVVNLTNSFNLRLSELNTTVKVSLAAFSEHCNILNKSHKRSAIKGYSMAARGANDGEVDALMVCALEWDLL